MPETYSQFNWVDGIPGATPLTAARLNQMEQGIESMDDRTTALEDRKSYLNAVTDFGAVGDGVAEDDDALDNAVAAALSQKKALYLPTGRYLRTTTWNCRGDNLHLFGDGPENSVILEGMGNAPTIQVGGYYQWVHDIGTEVASTKGANSNAVEVLDCAYGRYERITLLGPGRGLYQPQVPADGSGNGMWSCVFDTWRISGATICAINLKGYNTANTGSVFQNFYLAALEDDGEPTGPLAKFADFDELVINQLNIEHNIIPASALELETCLNTVINGLHFEGVELTGADSAFVKVVNQVRLTLNGCTIGGDTLNASNDVNAFLALDINASHVRVHGLYTSGNTLTATDRFLVLFGDCPGSTVTITGAMTGDFTALSSGDLTTIPMLKQVNDDRFHYTEAGKNVTFGTAAPTTGAWNLGDRRWNTSPTAGGTPGWFCTTGGSPGTWKAMANLAA